MKSGNFLLAEILFFFFQYLFANCDEIYFEKVVMLVDRGGIRLWKINLTVNWKLDVTKTEAFSIWFYFHVSRKCKQVC